MGLMLLLMCFIDPAMAQSCQPFKLTGKAIERWYNPHPSPNDYLLPMPLGMALVFVSIPLGTQGLYGDDKSTYIMGSKTPRLFETHLEVRVGSSIRGGGDARFLFGKYEVTKAQYISVIGNGVLEHGAKKLAERTKDPNARSILLAFTNGRCKGVMTREFYNFLSEPLTFLSYRDYIDFFDEYNLYCISRNNCRNRLSELGPNKDVPGFVRLPAEHEWEFVARGGQDFVAGRINKTEFQADLPRIKPGTTIKHHAHIGSDPPQPLPIGSRKPLFGIYDMFGNAQELMLNPFTAENGFGAVGAYVARGGHFRLSPKEVRVSRRVELQAFRLDEATNSFVIQYFPLTGIRAVVGYPVIGAAPRLGDSSLMQDFTENYTPPGEAGDIAGDTTADARDLGRISNKEFSISEELSSDDVVDYYKVTLTNYSMLSVTASSDVNLQFEISNESQEVVVRGKSDNRIRKSSALLPGDYWIKLTSAKRLAGKEKYRFSVARDLVSDTGIANPDSAALRNANSLHTSLQFEGYVGSGDTVDTYPIRDRSNVGGIELQILAFDAPVTLTYLDKKLNIVRRIESGSPSKNLAINVNSSFGQEGFIQVSSSAAVATTYQLKVVAKAPYDKIFVKNPKYVGLHGNENVGYEGNLDGSLPALYMPIRLNEPRTLKIELTELSADVDLRVFGADRKILRSSHIRKGTSPEFFAQPVAAGVYFAEIRLKSSKDISHFKLLHTTEKMPSGIYTINTTLAARSNAKDLGTLLSSGIAITDSSTQNTIYYKFHTQSIKQLVQVEVLHLFDSLEVSIEDHNGKVFSKSVNNNAIEADTQAELPLGTFFLKLKHSDSTGGTYFISMNSTIGMEEPDLSDYGNLIEVQKDFVIYRDQDQCSMITVAKLIQPKIGWRSKKPYFRITVERGKDTIGILMDNVWPNQFFELYRIGSVNAQVVGLGDIPAIWENYFLQPLDWNGYVSSEALRHFRKGWNLVITGTTRDRQTIRIEYSLAGYTKAAQRINQICRADANWIWDQ